MKTQRIVSSLFPEATEWVFPVPAQLSLLQVSDKHSNKNCRGNISTAGKYISKVDRVMTQVDRITEDIDHMPVAAFIFRDQESDEVHYSSSIRS